MLLSFLALVLFLANGLMPGLLISTVLFLTLVFIQVVLFKCPNCGERPGIWLILIWSILMNFELWLTEPVLLKRCSKCENRLLYSPTEKL